MRWPRYLDLYDLWITGPSSLTGLPQRREIARADHFHSQKKKWGQKYLKNGYISFSSSLFLIQWQLIIVLSRKVLTNMPCGKNKHKSVYWKINHSNRQGVICWFVSGSYNQCRSLLTATFSCPSIQVTLISCRDIWMWLPEVKKVSGGHFLMMSRCHLLSTMHKRSSNKKCCWITSCTNKNLSNQIELYILM